MKSFLGIYERGARRKLIEGGNRTTISVDPTNHPPLSSLENDKLHVNDFLGSTDIELKMEINREGEAGTFHYRVTTYRMRTLRPR